MIDMNTTIKRESSLSPAPTVKSEVLPSKKSTFFSIDQILGKREAELSDEDVFEKEDSDIDSFNGDKNLDDEEMSEPDVDNITELDGEKEDKEGKNDKQTPSYTAIIAQAILSSSDKKLPLGCIYDYIAEHFPEFLKKGQGWRNCVRHNLSLSECFIKAGRARNGRGNYWGIHPRYIKNFSKGDFRKRRASHRPRNRDIGLMGYGLGRYYSYYYSPYSVSQVYNKTGIISPNNRGGFSVDNLLGKERVANDIIPPTLGSYKSSWPSTRETSRDPILEAARSKERLRSPPTLSSVIPSGHSASYLEHYNYSHHPHHRSYEYGRTGGKTTECSCHSYACASSSRTYPKI